MMTSDREAAGMPNPHYMELQREIDAKMRTILVAWMSDAVASFALPPEALFTAVRLMDQFLSKKQVSTARLQLVGVAALNIASKFHMDCGIPSMADWEWMCDDEYTIEQIVRMERIVLNVLDHDVHTPTVFDFLDEDDRASVHLAEISLLSCAFLRYRPSAIAQACRGQLGHDPKVRRMLDELRKDTEGTYPRIHSRYQ
jgi:G2/mitotic-specific cyclin 1/2